MLVPAETAWTEIRTLPARTTVLAYSNVAARRFYDWSVFARDSSSIASHTTPKVDAPATAGTDQINFHEYTNFTGSQGYKVTENVNQDGEDLHAFLDSYNPSFPYYDFDGFLDASQRRIDANVFDFTGYANEDVYPSGDPDLSEALEVEWVGQGTFLGGAYSFVPCSVGGARHASAPYGASVFDSTLIPAHSFGLYRLPESMYAGTHPNAVSAIARPINLETIDMVSILSGLTPVGFWRGAAVGDPEYVGDGQYLYVDRPRWSCPVNSLDPSTNAVAFALVDSLFLTGTPDPGAYNSYFLHMMGSVSFGNNGPPGSTASYLHSSTFSFTWIPRSYRLLLPRQGSTSDVRVRFKSGR